MAGGRAGGRDDLERQYNDFHRCSQKTLKKNIVFFCRFASGGSASTDFYSSNEQGVQQMSKKHFVFYFSNQRSQVPIFIDQNTIFEHLPDPADPPEMEHELRLATHQQRAGGQDDGSLNKLPQMILIMFIFAFF